MRAPHRVVLALLAIFAIVGAACSNTSSTAEPGAGSSAPASGGDTVCATADMSAGDMLAKICESGTLRVATDPQYPPASSLDEATGEWEGFDVDTAQELATRLGVEIEWATPGWDVITAGSWSDRWDISVGSMTITPERAQVLDFTEPYYYTPAGLAVNEANTSLTEPADLSGKKVGVGIATTYEQYLEGTLEIPGYTIDFQVDGADIVTYKTDKFAIDDLALGDCARLCAAFSAIPILQGAIDAGKPIKLLGDPIYNEPLAVAVDKSAPTDDASFVQALNEMIAAMHDDGTLSDSSTKWFGVDYSEQQGV
ncbi:MAG: transporter substrate-binding domain-containing protein [Actinobacteria bacterium]|nr:transporter substrate-binding domain-containing protein [Actinomycetota bacterium]